ncbi:hypothetical protein [Streptomyces blattellae]|uniref:hypothetical protein n=1 Tax=Streptomyces blattellae TaxID=2569855 RepID=UPI0012B88B8A|nr:hypothetical protein [Streptomyces blattellae]
MTPQLPARVPEPCAPLASDSSNSRLSPRFTFVTEKVPPFSAISRAGRWRPRRFFVAGVPAAVVGMFVAVLIAKSMLDVPGREWFNR